MESSLWFYRDNDKSVGPFTFEKLSELHAYGLISDLTLVREYESREWTEFGDLDIAKNHSHDARVDFDLIAETHKITEIEIDGIEAENRYSQNQKAEFHDQINGWPIYPVTPWRRYGARILDISVNGAIGAFLLGMAWYAIAPMSAEAFFSSLNPVADILVTTFISIIISGILTGFSGSSIGKWVFGIRVTRSDGTPIGLINGVFRDLEVWVKGLALGIPLINLITLYMSYSKLKEGGSTSWDQGQGYVVTHRPNSWIQYTLNTLGILLIIIVQALLRMAEQM
jgi:uncharacterized RDD family membrane protein YckC